MQKSHLPRAMSFFYKWAIPTSISFIVFFSKKHYNFYNKFMSKNVQPVYHAGI